MSFWETSKATFWSDPSIEPKRPFRFLLPIPLVVPKEDRIAAHAWFSEHFTSNGAISRFNKWEGNDNLFEFPVVSCTKPGFKTAPVRTGTAAGGYTRIRPNQAAVYNFTPVIMEIVDTIGHDLESTLTALLYARGKIKSSYDVRTNPDPGRLISFGNEIEVIQGRCGEVSVQSNLNIYEINASTPFITDRRMGEWENPTNRAAGDPLVPDPLGIMGSRAPKARVLRLNNSQIVGAEFGSYDYRNTQISTIRLTIEYDSFDYKRSLIPWSDPIDPNDARENRRRRRVQRRQQRAAAPTVREERDAYLAHPDTQRASEQQKADKWVRKQGYGIGGWMP